MLVMEKPMLIYCYDAYCGWCYGFSPVMQKVAEAFKDKLDIEVLSGGMILPEKPVPISKTAGYIANAYKGVEEMTGIKFGQDYLWHIFNADESDWYPNSEKPAIALCIFRDYYPEKVVEFAAELQYALHYEGRDLTDDEAYRHLLEKYSIQPEVFYESLHSDEYKEQAYEEFGIVQQFQVTGFPTVLVQTGDSKFHMIVRGYTDEATFTQRLNDVLSATADQSAS